MTLDRATEAARHVAFYPSDLYYADLARADGSFDDWNGRADGIHALYFGEVHGETDKAGPVNFDAIDYRPEIAVGRWPVSDEAQTRRVAAKSIAFERAVREGRAPRRAGFVATGGWVDARALLDGAAAALGAGWEVERRYYADGAPAPTTPPSEAEVVALLDRGLALLAHAGHGLPEGFDGCLSVNTLASLRNEPHPAVVFSAGCSTATFAALPPYEDYRTAAGADQPGTNGGHVFAADPPPPAPYQSGPHARTGLGERLLREIPGGAVAYIGCNTGSQPCALTLLAAFVEAWGSAPSPVLGDAWSAALRTYWERERLAELVPTADWYPPSIFFQGMKFMLFGDPSLPLPGGAPAPVPSGV
jgi:hypothetical protein